MLQKACVPQDWKHAKLTPLHKSGPTTDPANYRMLAVSGTMYRLYINVLRSITTSWCQRYHKIPNTQFGFYPGRSTLQPVFILRHVQHAAQTLKPHQRSPRLHAAFIDFKQAYDCVPRLQLWQHLENIGMPAQLLSVIKDLYQDDEYILVDGDKRVSVRPARGVKQGCPLSPLLFSLYINDIPSITDGAQGAVTGSEGVQVSHLLYADDLTLLSNVPGQLQRMLNKLADYARKKHLTVNTKKSLVVHFNSGGGDEPTFYYQDQPLDTSDTFVYLGVLFCKTLNKTAVADHALKPMMASTFRVRQFLSEHKLKSRPHVGLWLSKAYVIPAGMYACQVWGTPFLKSGAEFQTSLQIWHLSLLKNILGVKRSAPNWAVLRECGQEPLQFYWFRAAVKFYNTTLQNTNPFLKGVLRADVRLSATTDKCWSAQFKSGFVGLSRGASYAQAVQDMQAVELKDLIPDLRARHVGVWRDVAHLDPCADNRKLTSYEHWMALPLRCRSMSSKMLPLPKYLCLNLSRNVQRNYSCFRLRAHRLAVETACWRHDGEQVCSCGCAERQDEKHVLLACRYPRVCTLRQTYSDLFGGLSSPSPSAGTLYVESSRAVPNYLVNQFVNQCNNRVYPFISELMDFFHTFSSMPSSQPV
jgi:hypothetical protein